MQRQQSNLTRNVNGGEETETFFPQTINGK